MRTWTPDPTRRLARGLTLMLALAAVAATKGPDGGGYTATDSVVYSLVDAAGTGGASVLAGVDDGVVPLVIPFPFRFYGVAYSVVCVSSNGALYFVGAATACSGFNDFGNVDTTAAPAPNDLPAAFPFWSDLTFEVAGAGSVVYQTTGALGSRRMVIQWNDAYPVGSPNPVTFQAVLAEGAHTLLFQYATVDLGSANPASKGGRATVGIRNSGAPGNSKQLSWSFNVPVIPNNSALQFATPIVKVAGDVDGDGVVNCVDVAIVRASYGKRTGQSGFDPRADLNRDGLVSLADLTAVTRALPAGTKCP
jgi:hypothetical protein